MQQRHLLSNRTWCFPLAFPFYVWTWYAEILFLLVQTNLLQNLVSASCHTSDYIKRLRYCEYLGRYFCQCCHENAQAVVPGRVLRKWDFSKYYVSNFARDLLSKIAGDPLFNPNDINSGLYKKNKSLEAVRVRNITLTRWMQMFGCVHSFLTLIGWNPTLITSFNEVLKRLSCTVDTRWNDTLRTLSIMI